MQDAKQETPDVVNIQEGIESIPDNFELTLASGEIINKSDIVKVSSSLNERGKLGEVNKENSPFFTINIETGELDADGKKIKEKVTFINEKAFNSYKSLSLELYKLLPSAGELKGTGIKIDHLLGEDYRGVGGEGRQGVYVWKGRDKNGKPRINPELPEVRGFGLRPEEQTQGNLVLQVVDSNGVIVSEKVTTEASLERNRNQLRQSVPSGGRIITARRREPITPPREEQAGLGSETEVMSENLIP